MHSLLSARAVSSFSHRTCDYVSRARAQETVSVCLNKDAIPSPGPLPVRVDDDDVRVDDDDARHPKRKKNKPGRKPSAKAAGAKGATNPGRKRKAAEEDDDDDGGSS